MDAPNINEVLAYAKPIIYKFISAKASDAPQEHKLEMEQQAYMRLLEAFPGIDKDAGWKSFVYTHARGAVLDYLKFGKGFTESRWSLSDSKKKKSARVPKLTQRVEVVTKGGKDEDVSVERALGQNGVFSEINLDRITIRWDLLARLASNDDHLHAFAKYLKGMTIEEMAPVFGVVRTRVSQMIQIFLERFDDPEIADDPYFKQVCYALGICKELGMKDEDQSAVMGFAMGWKLEPVDLDSVKPHQYLVEQASQMGLFDGVEEEGEEKH